MNSRLITSCLLSLSSYFALINAAPIPVNMTRILSTTLDPFDASLPAGTAWTKVNVTLASAAVATSTLILFVVLSDDLLRVRTHWSNQRLRRLLRLDGLQSYLGLLLILFGLCIDIARATELDQCSVNHSASITSLVSDSSMATPAAMDIPPTDWLLPRASDSLFVVTAAVIVLGVLEMLYSVPRMDNMNVVRTKRVATAVGLAMIVRFLDGAIFAIAGEPMQSLMTTGDEVLLPPWLWIAYTMGLAALVNIVVGMACLFAMSFVEVGSPRLLPGNLKLRLMSFLVIGSIHMDVANVEIPPRTCEAVVSTLTSTHCCTNCSTSGVSTAHAYDLFTAGSTNASSHLHLFIPVTDLLDLSTNSGAPSPKHTLLSGQTYALPGTGQGRLGSVVVILSNMITIAMIIATYILLNRVFTREHGVTKLISFACLLTGLISVLTSIGVIGAMREASKRPTTQVIDRDTWVNLGTTQYAAAVLLMFAVVFEGIVELGWPLRDAERDLRRLLPRAVRIGYTEKFVVLCATFADLAGASDANDLGASSLATTTSTLATGSSSVNLPSQFPWPNTDTQTVILASIIFLQLLYFTVEVRHRIPTSEKLIARILYKATTVLSIVVMSISALVALIFLQNSRRTGEVLTEADDEMLGIVLGVSTAIWSVVCILEGAVARNWIENFGAWLLWLLPRDIHLDCLGELFLAGGLFAGVAGAAEASEAMTATALASVAPLALAMQAPTLLPPYVSWNGTLVPYFGVSRSADSVLDGIAMGAIAVAGAVASALYIFLPKPHPHGQWGLASKAAMAVAIPFGFLCSIANAAETALPMMTTVALTAPSVETTGTPGFWIASVRGFRHSGLALETVIIVVFTIGFAYSAATAVQTAWQVATNYSVPLPPTKPATATIPLIASSPKNGISSWLVAAVLLVLASSVSGQIYGIVPGTTRTSTSAITIPGPTMTTTLTVPQLKGIVAANTQQPQSWHRGFFDPRTLQTRASPSPATDIPTTEVDREPRDQASRVEAPGTTSPGATRLAVLLALLTLTAILFPAALAW